MDNRINLAEYLSSHRVVDEKRKIFYVIFKEMHRLHNNGEYITKLSFQSISVCFTNILDIKFGYCEKIGKMPLEEVMKLKISNIRLLTHMMMCSFLDSFDYNTALLNMGVLISNLDSIKNCYHKDDLDYFKEVMENENYLYYDDYRNKLEGITPESNNDEGAFANYFLLIMNLMIVVILALGFLYFGIL